MPSKTVRRACVIEVGAELEIDVHSWHLVPVNPKFFKFRTHLAYQGQVNHYPVLTEINANADGAR